MFRVLSLVIRLYYPVFYSLAQLLKYVLMFRIIRQVDQFMGIFQQVIELFGWSGAIG